MQLLFEVEGGPSSCGSYLTPSGLSELSLSALISILFKKNTGALLSLQHINNPDQLTCQQYCLERHIFHKVWAFICPCGDYICLFPAQWAPVVGGGFRNWAGLGQSFKEGNKEPAVGYSS